MSRRGPSILDNRPILNLLTMVDDERRSEQFIREVDEELRRAQLKAIWDRFAPLIIGVCLLVVAVTAGYRGWEWWRSRQAADAGDRFSSAVEDLQAGKRDAGEAELQAIARSGGGGYPALARFRLAGEKAAAGQKAEAIAAYDGIAADGAVAATLRDLARIRAALLSLDNGDAAGAKQRAESLNQPGNPWRHAAREVLGTAAYQAGDLQQARDLFTSIQQDAETPPDLAVRSGMMVSLIDGQLPAPGAEGQPPPAAPAASAPAEAPLPASGPAANFDEPPAAGTEPPAAATETAPPAAEATPPASPASAASPPAPSPATPASPVPAASPAPATTPAPPVTPAAPAAATSSAPVSPAPATPAPSAPAPTAATSPAAPPSAPPSSAAPAAAAPAPASSGPSVPPVELGAPAAAPGVPQAPAPGGTQAPGPAAQPAIPPQ